MKKTALNGCHIALGAKLIDFGGWEMPVQYTGIVDEHIATREHAGLFDVSHMGEIWFKGKNAKNVLNMLITNDINQMQPKKVMYTPIPNEKGGVVDDMLIYMFGDEEFLLVVNASNIDKDFAWFKEKAFEISQEICVSNVSDEYSQIAIQGPNAQAILQEITDSDLSLIKFFCFENINLMGKTALVSRTGYTGEDGFEIYCTNEIVAGLWNELLQVGKAKGLVPVGLGARDTLRFEAALPLYGHEIYDDISPVEAALKYFVKPDKGDFIGKDIIAKQYTEGTMRKLYGIEMVERGIPRSDYRVEKEGKDVGYVTSGTHSPTFKNGLAMALLAVENIKIDDEVDVVIRDKRVKGKIVKLPFYKKKTQSK